MQRQNSEPPLPPRWPGGGRLTGTETHRTRRRPDREAVDAGHQELEAVLEAVGERIGCEPNSATGRNVARAATAAGLEIAVVTGWLLAAGRRGRFDRAEGFGLVVHLVAHEAAGAVAALAALQTAAVEAAGQTAGEGVAVPLAASPPASGPAWEAAVRRQLRHDPEWAGEVIARRRRLAGGAA